MSLNLEQMKLSGFEPDPDLKWDKIGDILPRSGVVPVAIDKHRILVIESSIDESFVRSFDTRTKSWSTEEWPSLNQPREEFGCAVCNDKIYVIGGEGTDKLFDSIECLDFSASRRRWVTLDQRLETARIQLNCVAIGTQVFILGGFGEVEDEQNCARLESVEILNTVTGQLSHGPNLPQHVGITAGAVNNELLVFANTRIKGDAEICKIHSLQTGQPNPTWDTRTASHMIPSRPIYNVPIIVGDCVALAPWSVYDPNRDCFWNLPSTPLNYFEWTVVGGTEIVAFGENKIYSLKMKLNVQPPTATVLRHTKTVWGAMLFSPKFSDVTLVCPEGTEIPAHRIILAGNSLYFDTYFSGRWAEQHPDGRYETEKSSDVIKPLLSLMYTGEIPLDTDDSTLGGLLDAAYSFQLNDDLLRVCQRKCIENMNESNVKDFLLISAKPRNATFLFDACFKYVCEHYFEIIGKDPVFTGDVIKVDDGQLWRDISESVQRLSRKRPREESA